MERTSSQNWFWPECTARGTELLSSPAPLGQSAGFGELWREKCTRAPLIGSFCLNWPEPVLFDQPDGKQIAQPVLCYTVTAQTEPISYTLDHCDRSSRPESYRHAKTF